MKTIADRSAVQFVQDSISSALIVIGLHAVSGGPRQFVILQSHLLLQLAQVSCNCWHISWRGCGIEFSGKLVF